MHSNIDTAERGQVPNASQLDPAQTQTDRQTEGGEGGSVDESFHKLHHLNTSNGTLC